MEKKLSKLRAELLKHIYYYYTLSKPIISDAEYDKLYREYISLGGGVLPLGFVKKGISHISPMLSLDNLFTIEDLEKWVENIWKIDKSITFSVEPKIDGVSINLIYVDGQLVRALTRGDGSKGEDVTFNIDYIDGISKTIDLKGVVELRGEVFITKDDFNRVNKELEEDGKNTFSTARNLASGTLRNTNKDLVIDRKLVFRCYQVNREESNGEYLSDLLDVQLSRVKIIRYTECKNLKEVISKVNHIYRVKDNYKYDIDGVVIKVNNIKYREVLGETNRVPKWAIAYKFPSVGEVSTVESVDWQVSRTGSLNPVARILPVSVNGTTISNVTLHNINEIKRKSIKIGSVVIVRRAGEVIPEIVEVLNPTIGLDIEIPSVCPTCNSKVVLFDYVPYCTNNECKDQVINRILYFLNTLEVKQIANATVLSLYDKGLIKSELDLFKLSLEDLSYLGNETSQVIYNNLSKVKSEGIDAISFITSLCIPNVGKSTAKIIAREVLDQDIEDIFELSKDDLVCIKGIGDVVASNIVNYISNNESYISQLIKTFPIKMVAKIKRPKVAITGSMGLSRKDIIKQLEENGFDYTDTVSKETDYLLYGENTGSKLDKAIKLGIKTVAFNESSFIDDLK